MIDWDAELLAPVMQVFGEGDPADQSTWPLYTPRGLPSFRLADAVFDAEYLGLNDTPGDDAGQASRRPVLGVRLSLFPRPPAQNDRVYVPSVGTNYVVKNTEADGHGHVKLMLMVAA